MKKNLAMRIFMLIAVFLFSSAFSQVKPKSLLDYQQAALKQNLLINSAQQMRMSAQYSSDAIRKGYRPQFGVGSHLMVAPGYDPAMTNGGEFGAQIVGSYMLYDGGAKKMEIRKGGLGTEQGKLNESMTKADVIYSVSIAYITAVKEKKELEISQDNYRSLRNYLQFLQQLHAAGQGNETDVLKTTVDLNNAEIDVNSRSNAFANSLMNLTQISGLSVQEVTEVDTTTLSIPYDTTFHVATNAEIQFQKIALQQAKLNAQLAQSQFRPKVSLVADAGALSSLPNLQKGFANVFGASAGVSVSMPIFTFGSLKSNSSAAAANAKSVAFQNEYSLSVMNHDFAATKNEIVSADSEKVALQRNLVVASQNVLLCQARYAGGSGLSLEVLDAIQTVHQIKIAIEDAQARKEENVLRLNRFNYSGVNQQ